MTALDRRIAIGLSLLMPLIVAVNLIAFQQKRDVKADAAVSPPPNWADGSVAAPVVAAAGEKTSGGPGLHGKPDTAASDPAETIRGIQRELNVKKYDAGPPDGVAGLVTRAAIFAYEYDNGLALSGRPSQQLLSDLVLGTSSLTSSNQPRTGRTLTPDGDVFVRGVKQQLASLGYKTGPAATALTPEFARAVRQFEAEQKLKETGRISAPMMSRLIRLEADAKARRPAAQR